MQQVPQQASPTVHVPLNIAQTAAVYHLSTPQTTYRNSARIASFGGLWFVYLGIVGTVVFFVSTDLNTKWWGWLLWFAFLLLMTLGILFFLFKAVPLRVFAYPEGLIYSRKSRIEVIRWDQIEAYWEEITSHNDSGDSYSYRIQRSDGITFAFPSDINQIEALGRLIKQRVDQYLLPQILAAYHAGTSISFGDLNVSQQEIYVNRSHATLSWDEFESFILSENEINIYRKGQQSAWYNQRVAQIANSGVLLQLLNTIIQERMQHYLPQAIATYKMGSPVIFGRIGLSAQGIMIDGGKSVLPWKDVKSVDVDIQGRKISIYAYSQLLSWQTFPVWMTPDIFLLKGLADTVLQEQRSHRETLVQSQIPQLIASYQNGIPLSFGRIRLSLQGIEIDGGKQFLPWNQVERVYRGTYIGGDRLTIVKKGKILAWQSLLISQLADIDLLTELIEHIMSTVH